MKVLKLISLLVIFSKNSINCGSSPCFEYSCDECETQEYGKCTKCRDGWTLVDGTCPCTDSSCALCDSGLAGLHLCVLCKKGYYRFNNDCYCEINNCEQCGENSCLKCITGYFYNSTSKNCEKLKDEDKISCYDSNCDSCYSSEKGACDYCKEGYTERKGECIELPIPSEDNICPEGYYISGGVCLEKCGKVNCTNLYSHYLQSYYTCDINKCLVCVNNVLKIFSECDNSDECSSIDGCLNCITNEECVVCSQGYYLLNGLCIKCSEGCSICSNSETCEYCISGYELNSDLKCNLTYNFDFDTSKYNNYKQKLIEIYHKDEIPKPIETSLPSNEISTVMTITKIDNENLPNILECDTNCIKCYDNIGKCIECDKLYLLNNNKCMKHCSDDNCIDCYLEDDTEYCSECDNGYILNNKKCNLICSDEKCSKCYLSDNTQFCSQCKYGYKLLDGECIVKCEDENCELCSSDGKNCTKCEEEKKLFDGKCADQNSICSQHFQFCNYCFGTEKCVECQKGYNFDSTGKICQKNTSYLSFLFTILGIAIFFIGIISFCIYRKRKNDLRNEIRRMRMSNQNQNNVYIYERRNTNRSAGSQRSIITKDILADEFEIQKRKIEKGRQVCQFCKKSPGKFTCDCGCIVCKEHSNLEKIEGEGENYKVCFVCKKIVKKVNPIKYQCHICMQNKNNVTHFKCGCALEVCKNCYIKCKMGSNKCPGCRAII